MYREAPVSCISVCGPGRFFFSCRVSWEPGAITKVEDIVSVAPRPVSRSAGSDWWKLMCPLPPSGLALCRTAIWPRSPLGNPSPVSKTPPGRPHFCLPPFSLFTVCFSSRLHVLRVSLLSCFCLESFSSPKVEALCYNLGRSLQI